MCSWYITSKKSRKVKKVMLSNQAGLQHKRISSCSTAYKFIHAMEARRGTPNFHTMDCSRMRYCAIVGFVGLGEKGSFS